LRVAIIITAETTVSVCDVVLKLGRIHSTKLSSTTLRRPDTSVSYEQGIWQWATHILMNFPRHLFRKGPKVNGISIPTRNHNQFFLALMSDKNRTQLFGMSIDAS